MYLKSKKLKKRNANFMEVFQRINEELKTRKSNVSDEQILEYSGIRKESFDNLSKVEIIPKRTMSSTLSVKSSLDCEETGTEAPVKMLKRKVSTSQVLLEVEIPSFFHDKNQRFQFGETKQKPETVKKNQKTEDLEKPTFKKCISGKFYY